MSVNSDCMEGRYIPKKFLDGGPPSDMIISIKFLPTKVLKMIQLGHTLNWVELRGGLFWKNPGVFKFRVLLQFY